MSYEKPVKLSVLYSRDKKAFAEKVTNIVKENYDEYSVYREKCAENERYWRNKHWDEKPFKDKTDESKPRPNVPVMHATIENCAADLLDNRPGQVIRGVGNDDDLKALVETEILRFTFQRANYDRIFEKKARAMLKRGEGTAMPYWNPELMNGMGDVDFEYLHVKNFAWDKSADDVNKGRFFAKIDWVQPEELYEFYPDLDLNEAMPEDDSEKEQTEEVKDIESIRLTDDDGNVKVTTFMWKEREPRIVKIPDPSNPAQVIEQTMGHITYINTAVICGNAVLEYKPRQYEYDRFFVNIVTDIELEGEPVGLSEIDIHKDDADTVNLIEQQYLCNLQASAEDRFLVNRTAGIDEKELLNYRKKIVHGNQIHQGAVTPFKPTLFSGQVLTFQQSVIDGIKERSGQTDFNTGQTNMGVTSGVGIQSLQQYGAKRSRLRQFRVYVDHKNTVKDVLKLIQTHYTTERVIRLSREAQDEIEERLKKAAQALQQAQEQAAEQGQEGTDISALAASAVLPEGVVLKGNELTIDFSIFKLDNIDLDYDIEIIPQRMNMVTSDAINSFIGTLANSKTIDGMTALELSEFEGKERMMKVIRKRNDIKAQMQQIAQQAQDAAAQAEEYAKTAEKQAKEIEKQQNKIIDLTIRLAAQTIANNSEGEGEGAGKQPMTADEAYQQIMAVVQGQDQGQATA
jgi:hypothetical protein